MHRQRLIAATRMLVPWLVLALLVTYSYLKLFQMPYIGFYYALDGYIYNVYTSQSGELQPGDLLLRVNNVPYAAHQHSSRTPLFAGLKPGDEIEMQVERTGEDGDTRQLRLSWRMPGFNGVEFIQRLNLIWAPFLVWAFGALGAWLIRPNDERWFLFMAFAFLTALWLMFGQFSYSRLWATSLLFHSVVWLSWPVYWHFHWVFPQPLGPLPKKFFSGLYLLAGLLILVEWLLPVPPPVYIIGLLLALFGSVVLLFLHVLRRPEQRQDLWVLAIAVGGALMPMILVLFLAAVGVTSNFSSVALLPLLALPGVYFYTLHRRRFGRHEPRANRAISGLLFAESVFLGLMVVLGSAHWLWDDAGVDRFIVFVPALMLGIGLGLVFIPFQRLVEQKVLSIPQPLDELVQRFSGRITATWELDELKELLLQDVFPSLQIRQALLLRINDQSEDRPERVTSNTQVTQPVLALNVSASQFPRLAEIVALLAQAGQYRDPETGPCAWARVVLPLQVLGKTIGICLLGARGIDSYYSYVEIRSLQVLMDATALALRNIEQADDLRLLYQMDIQRQEAERKRLAHELHDGVLGQLAVLAMNVDERSAGPQFDPLYRATVQRIRDLISGLRPGSLVLGLQPALEQLLDDLQAQAEPSQVAVRLEVSGQGFRYPDEVELHLFRIVQQASENALKHAQSQQVCIQGRLEAGLVELEVVDDGRGFRYEQQFQLSRLLAEEHYGLVGMHERAALIDAQLSISATPGEGTRVVVLWRGSGQG